MRLLPRLLAVGLMLAAMYFLVQHVKAMETLPDADSAKISTYFLGLVGLGAVVAIICGILLLPIIGELAGNFVFTPNVEIEKSPHSAALAKIAAGDYAAAVEEYKKVFEADPEDVHAANEVVRLFCDKLETPEPAADFLIEVLSREGLTPEHWAYFSERMVDVSWDYLRDAERSTAILRQIAEAMPETREAANALHRCAEIERTAGEEAYLAQQAAAQQAAQQAGAQGEGGEAPASDKDASAQV